MPRSSGADALRACVAGPIAAAVPAVEPDPRDGGELEAAEAEVEAEAARSSRCGDSGDGTGKEELDAGGGEEQAEGVGRSESEVKGKVSEERASGGCVVSASGVNSNPAPARGSARSGFKLTLGLLTVTAGFFSG